MEVLQINAFFSFALDRERLCHVPATFSSRVPLPAGTEQMDRCGSEKVRTFWKRDVIFPVQGIEPQVPGYPIRSLVTVPAELLRLPYYSTGSS
jgi:hypothetical protein